jgi:hypothetical protein
MKEAVSHLVSILFIIINAIMKMGIKKETINKLSLLNNFLLKAIPPI